MSAGKRSREADAPAVSRLKKALFEDRETESLVVCAIDFGTARTGFGYAYTQTPGAYPQPRCILQERRQIPLACVCQPSLDEFFLICSVIS